MAMAPSSILKSPISSPTSSSRSSPYLPFHPHLSFRPSNRPSLNLHVVCASKISPSQRPSTSPPEKESPLAPLQPSDDYVRPKLPGDEPDFWEGPQWNTLGFVVQYLWAIGIFVALIGCGIAVKTYNFGASDFKETIVYKEALESQGIFEEITETQEPGVSAAQDVPSLQESSN